MMWDARCAGLQQSMLDSFSASGWSAIIPFDVETQPLWHKFDARAGLCSNDFLVPRHSYAECEASVVGMPLFKSHLQEREIQG